MTGPPPTAIEKAAAKPAGLEPSLRLGGYACINGLKQNKELNGEVGLLLAFAEDRWQIQTSYGVKAVKPSQLLGSFPKVPALVRRVLVGGIFATAVLLLELLRTAGRRQMSAAMLPASVGMWLSITAFSASRIHRPMMRATGYSMSFTEMTIAQPARQVHRFNTFVVAVLMFILALMYFAVLIPQAYDTPAAVRGMEGAAMMCMAGMGLAISSVWTYEQGSVKTHWQTAHLITLIMIFISTLWHVDSSNQIMRSTTNPKLGLHSIGSKLGLKLRYAAAFSMPMNVFVFPLLVMVHPKYSSWRNIMSAAEWVGFYHIVVIYSSYCFDFWTALDPF